MFVIFWKRKLKVAYKFPGYILVKKFKSQTCLWSFEKVAYKFPGYIYKLGRNYVKLPLTFY